MRRDITQIILNGGITITQRLCFGGALYIIAKGLAIFIIKR